MKIHLMPTHIDDSIDGLNEISLTAHNFNYNSVLLVYHSLKDDPWIKCAATLNKNHSFKYMIALRTYAISPEYFFMMYKSFESIQKNRIMFNIVSGDLHQEEESLENLLLLKKHIDTSEKRIKYTESWIKKVKELFNKENLIMPEIVMSGTSDQTLKNAKIFADYNLSMISEFKDSPKRFSNNKKIMVSAAVVLRNSLAEANFFVNNNLEFPHQKKWTICGSEKEVIHEIKKLKNMGATDLMVRFHNNDNSYYAFNEIVKKHKGIIE